jgi:hypothetical protein
MTLLRRIVALEQQRPAIDEAAISIWANTLLDTLAAEGSDEAIPDRATVLAALRGGTALACRSHLFRRAGDELLVRHYPGVDLRLLQGGGP